MDKRLVNGDCENERERKASVGMEIGSSCAELGFEAKARQMVWQTD